MLMFANLVLLMCKGKEERRFFHVSIENRINHQWNKTSENDYALG